MADPLKYGFYSRAITREDITALRKMPPDDLNPEIAVLRYLIGRLLELYNQQTDPGYAVLIANAATRAVKTLDNLVRTHTQLEDDRDPVNPLDKILEDYLREEPFYLDAPLPEPPPEPTGKEAELLHQIFSVRPPDESAKIPRHFPSLRRRHPRQKPLRRKNTRRASNPAGNAPPPPAANPLDASSRSFKAAPVRAPRLAVRLPSPRGPLRLVDPASLPASPAAPAPAWPHPRVSRAGPPVCVDRPRSHPSLARRRPP